MSLIRVGKKHPVEWITL